jgi:putative tricarboxylic transport membrane protein
MPVYVRSIPIGIGIGILPGVGATTAAFVSYAQAAKFSKEPEKFGTGIPEGIAAPESANNAAAMGAMVPLLALGIPGSATTAVMLGAVILHGLRPGPLLFETHPQFVYAIMLAAIVANLLIIVVSPLFIRFFARVLQVPRGVLGTLILTLCIVGSFAIRNNIVDVWLVFVFGILGYILEKHKYPIAPIVIGVVLGKLFEEELRRTLIISGGDLTVFFTRPIAAAFIVATLLLLVVPVFGALRRQLQTRKTR